REFVDQLSYFPGVLPTEVAMAAYLTDNGAALNRDLRFMENTRARIDDRIVIEQGEVLGFKSQELNSSNRQRIAESQIKIQRSAESKKKEILKSDVEALKASEGIAGVSIPENLSLLDLARSGERPLFAKLIDEVRFQELKKAFSFSRSKNLDRVIKDQKLSDSEILSIEKMEFIQTRTPEQLTQIFSRSEIELVFRVTQKMNQISEARKNIFEIFQRRDLEMAWREMQGFEISNSQMPERIEDLNVRFQSRRESMVFEAFDSHSLRFLEAVGREPMAEAIYQRLSMKEKNFLGTELVSADYLREINFRLPEDSFLPGLSDDVLKAFISENLPRFVKEELIATKIKDHILENLDSLIPKLRESSLREFDSFKNDLTRLEKDRALLESWLTSQP
ncbi:MAG: hypothetical protein ACO3LE_10820, partial [Bdellovibrionota bacterium]